MQQLSKINGKKKKNPNNPGRKWAKAINRHFTEEDTQVANNTWKDVPHQLPREECKWKPQGRGDYTPKIQNSDNNTHAIQESGKPGQGSIPSANVWHCGHLEKGYGSFLQNYGCAYQNNPDTSLLNIYPRQMQTNVNTKSVTNVHSHSKIAQTLKQSDSLHCGMPKWQNSTHQQKRVSYRHTQLLGRLSRSHGRWRHPNSKGEGLEDSI